MAPHALLIAGTLVAAALAAPGASAAASEATCRAAAAESAGDEYCSMLQVRAAGRAAQLEASSQNRTARRYGQTIPLHVQRGASCTEQVAEVAMFIQVATDAVASMTNYKRLRLDTGSSTLAFCPSGPPIQHLDNLAMCDAYGDPGEAAPAWWGWTYEQILLVDTGGNTEFKIEFATYSIMSEQTKMGCDGGNPIGGIFGIAFKSNNPAYTVSDPSCAPDESTPGGDYCASSCFAYAREVTPVLSHLLNDEGSPQSVGIYWSGEVGDSQGMLYLDDEARSNVHYTQGSLSAMTAWLGESGFYEFRAVFVVVFDEGVSHPFPFQGECEKDAGACVMDTGTPGINLPEDIYEQYQQASMGATLYITLQGAEGQKDPVLAFKKSQLEALKVYGPTSGFGAVLKGGPAGTHGSFTLGMATWAFYYTIFDISPTPALVFVPHFVCDPDAHVQCPGSDTICSGAQCCPRVAESFGKTFTCPSAPVGLNDCEALYKLSNCLAPSLACDQYS